jgi:hypothetical protein
MQPVDFYALPRAAQERFVGSVCGTGLPAPILRKAGRPLEPFAWIGVSATSLVLLLFLCRAGYGDLYGGLARQGFGWVFPYVALVGLSIFAGLRAFAILHEHGRSPFPRGVYLFPVGLIDARRSEFHVYPIEDLADVVGPIANTFTLEFGEKSFAFRVEDEELAGIASREIAGARGTIDEARGASESMRPKALAALDPLQGFTNPLGSPEKMLSTKPAWGRFAWAIAALAGAAIGGSVWIVRNAKSDDAMYEHAIAANDSPSLREYLAKGSRHAPEVSSLLLPRAELRDAEKAGTVEAIEDFIATHPESSISSEVTVALKAALLSELDVAVKVGTLTAVDEFIHRHPHAPIEADVHRARHGVFVAAYDRYAAAAPPKAQAELTFVQALLSWAETHGTRVDVRLHRQRSKTVEKADSAVAKHRMFRGAVSLPSRYFDGDGEKPYEDALVNATIQRFARAFPADILALAAGEPIADTDASLPEKIDVPALFIEHGASWHGAAIISRDPHGIFCGLELSFDALFRIPDSTKPLKVNADAWLLPDLAAAKGNDRAEEAVYGEMHAKAFDLFQKKLLGAFFEGA